jgi:hypothetical protein
VVNPYLAHLVPPSPDEQGSLGAEAWEDYAAALDAIAGAMPALRSELAPRARTARERAVTAREQGETRAAIREADGRELPQRRDVVRAEPIEGPPPPGPTLGLADRRLGPQPPRS